MLFPDIDVSMERMEEDDGVDAEILSMVFISEPIVPSVVCIELSTVWVGRGNNRVSPGSAVNSRGVGVLRLFGVVKATAVARAVGGSNSPL